MHNDDIEMVLKTMVENFPHKWVAIDSNFTNELKEKLPEGRVKKFYELISDGYNNERLPIGDVFHNVVNHAARQTTIHFRGKFEGTELHVEGIDRLLRSAPGLFIHLYPNVHAYPVDYLVQIQPGTCLILMHVFDRPLSSADSLNPYKAQGLDQFVAQVPITVLPELLHKFFSHSKTIVVIDPSFFDAKSNSVFGVEIPEGKK